MTIGRVGSRVGADIGIDPSWRPGAPTLTLYGGSGWDVSNRLAGALGGTYRGNATGHTIACLCRINAQVLNGKLLDYLDTSGKGWDLYQDTVSSVRWRNANAAGNAWFSSAAYAPAGDIGKVQLLLMRFTGAALQMWASDAQVGADVACDGYTLPATSFRWAIGCRQSGAQAHTGADIFGWGAWDRAFTVNEVHSLYAAVKSTGKLPLGLAGEALVMNVGDDVSGAAFPATITDQVAANDFTFVAGAASGIDLVTGSNPTFAW